MGWRALGRRRVRFCAWGGLGSSDRSAHFCSFTLGLRALHALNFVALIVSNGGAPFAVDVDRCSSDGACQRWFFANAQTTTSDASC
jgi:hypothetical protein